jgi:hypothetical protein
MGLVRTVAVRPEDGELRLDRWFKRHFPTLAHGRLERLLRTGQIRVDGKRAKASDRVAPGMEVRVPPLGPETEAPRPERPAPRPRDVEKLLAAVLYRDDDVIAINKPPGLAVQGGSGTERHLDMMLDALRFGAAERPRLVHRLDRDTSGVLPSPAARRRPRRSAPPSATRRRARSTGPWWWERPARAPARSTCRSPSRPGRAASASPSTRTKASGR